MSESTAAQIEALLAEHDAAHLMASADDKDRLRDVWVRLGDLGFRSIEQARGNLSAIPQAG